MAIASESRILRRNCNTLGKKWRGCIEMRSWSIWVQKIGTQLVGWLTRRRRAGAFLLSAGALLAGGGLLGDGFTLSLMHESGQGRLAGSLTTGDGLPAVLKLVGSWLGLLLMFLGAALFVLEWIAERRVARRSLIVVVELRGLIDTADRPLLEAIPRGTAGQPADAHVDVRSYMDAGDLKGALNQLQGLPDTVRRMRGQRDRSNVTVVAGGVLQVPFLFYAGVLLDDEGGVIQLDWDRELEKWRELDDVDDGARFEVSGLNTLPSETRRVVLSVSASYATDVGAISVTFGASPVVSLALPRPLPNTLWSEEKQAALATQFLEVLAELGNKGVCSVDLVLAAPSSLALRIGRAYDARNLPSLRCYQYQKNAHPPYPWCLEINGPGEAKVLHLA
ncbi:SAVED domain-containing protein [Luteimonas sp. A277]